MDGRTFDTMTRHLAAAQSRRQVMRTLAGGTLGAALGVLGLREAAAQDAANCKSRLGSCNRTAQCCEEHDVSCRRLSRECRQDTGLRGERCCGIRGAKCAGDCDCCRGFTCRENECRRR